MMMNEAAKQFDFHHLKAESRVRIICDFIFFNQILIINPEFPVYLSFVSYYFPTFCFIL